MKNKPDYSSPETNIDSNPLKRTRSQGSETPQSQITNASIPLTSVFSRVFRNITNLGNSSIDSFLTSSINQQSYSAKKMHLSNQGKHMYTFLGIYVIVLALIVRRVNKLPAVSNVRVRCCFWTCFNGPSKLKAYAEISSYTI